MSTSKYAANVTKKCQDKLMALADCASDNDAFADGTITSLNTVDGCCLKPCVEAIEDVSLRPRGGERAGGSLVGGEKYALVRSSGPAGRRTNKRNTHH